MTTLRSLLLAIAGKGAERGMEPEIREDINTVVFRYGRPTDEREDNLHKQSIRSTVTRVGGDEWKIHITSLGETGFSAEVRPAPGVKVGDEQETEATEPTDKVAGFIQSLEQIIDHLRKMAA